MVRASKIAVALQLIIAIPGILIAVMGVMAMSDPRYYDNADTLLLGSMMVLAITAILVVCILVGMKKKYPYYSDAKARYIMKQRKGK